MTRAQRALHPVIWALVLAVAAAVVASAWRARPSETPPSLPQAAVSAIEETR
ncbi:MAG: hypothetical protein PVI23_07370 [Maricaulaceae bacterium]|jgi:hypothetical protein